jgi:hypothetical protein
MDSYEEAGEVHRERRSMKVEIAWFVVYKVHQHRRAEWVIFRRKSTTVVLF